MKAFSVLTFGVLVGLCAVTGVNAAGQNDRQGDQGKSDQVCVYKDINYQGAVQCYSAGDELNTLGTQNRSISSIRLYGRATVTVYENTSFGGHSAQFTSDVPDLGRRIMQGNTSWSDRIDSLRISGYSGVPNIDERKYPTDSRPNVQRRQQPRDGICVYDRPNYEGRSECWNQGQNVSDLTRQGNWNGQISSIRLFGNSLAVVYQDTGYRGESLTVDRDIPDLAAIRGRGPGYGNGRGRGYGKNVENWDRQISSVKVQAQQRRYR
jgi:Peptidase inhibitor family I36